MNEAIARQRLEQAENDLIQEQKHIDDQKLVVDRLRESGHDSSQAEKILATFEHSKQAVEKYRNILLEQVGLYEAGESGAHPGVAMPDHKDLTDP